MSTFGEWLREQREARKLNREEFARLIGCSVAMLRKIEDGERRPSVQIAGLMANCLDIPADERETFIKVARGELSTNRLASESKRSLPTSLSSLDHFPVLPTPLIGRKKDIDQLKEILRDPHCRLLTITGPGGIGKTRLALELAAQCRSEYADGIYFIPLAPVQSARFIVPVIADSLGFGFQAETLLDPKLQLFHYLNRRHTLLLIDNLEHLLGEPGVAEFFAELMASAPQTHLLATSREPLDLQGEWIFAARGLTIPDSMENVEGTSAELFLQRARRANVSFDATRDDYPAIIRICSLLEGLPLGIELAAAWVRTLSCEEIALEIESGLDFLSVSAKDLPTRHRSMRAVFDHSWKLLSEEEQNVLLRTSVFQGGFSRDAAQHVAEAGLSTLSTLVAKSLIRRNGTGRYDLHELIRQFAYEYLAQHSKIQKDVQTRHGRYYVEFLSGQDLRLRGPQQRKAIAEVTADIDNIRSALEWALARGEFDLIEPSLRAYSTFFDTLGWSQEALETLGQMIKALDSQPSLAWTDQVALAHLLTSRSLFAYRAAQNTEARVMLDRSLEILKPLNAPHVLVEALTFKGIITLIGGDMPGALQLFEQGLEVASENNDPWYEALCLTEVVGVKTMMGQAENAHEQFRLAVEAWRKTGDLRFTAFGLNYLSLGAIATGEYKAARQALEESIAINRDVGDRWGLGISYRGLGLVARAEGDHERALLSFRRSLDVFNELGSHWDAARVLSEMGQSTFALGNDSEAEHLWRESLCLSVETNGILTIMEALVGFAELMIKRGQYQDALQILLICIQHPATIQETKARAIQTAAEIEEKLSMEDVAAAKIFAAEHTYESIVQELLG